MVDDTIYRESSPKPSTEDLEDYIVCSQCRYWLPFNKQTQDGSKGECRRYPPCNDDVGCFPVTRIIDWCGEFKALSDDD